MTTITAGLTLIVAFSGAIKAGPDIAPYLPAHRGYVVQLVSDSANEVKPVINQLLSNSIRQEQRSLAREQAQWTIKLQTEVDGQSRRMIENRLNQISDEDARLQKQLQRLQSND